MPRDAWAVFLTHTEEDLRLYFDAGALAALGETAEVRRNPLGRRLAPGELAEHAAGCAVILSEWETGADAATFAALPALVAFVRCGVEHRNVDVDAASAAGVLVVNTPGLYVAPVVELTVAFMVCLARGVVDHAVALRGGRVRESRFGTELRGKTLGIVGLGDIGRALAGVARALGMTVCFADPHVGPQPELERLPLAELLARADFVSLHARWTPETEGMFGEAEFRRMKPSAYFINTARGALVDEAALERALHAGWIAGAALDVFRAEPEIAGHPLLALPNVIGTPHIGGITPETMRAQAWQTVEIVRDLRAGRVPASAVNRPAAGRLRLGRRPP
jgi:D-3-phosphoglycerate dehydrogenase